MQTISLRLIEKHNGVVIGDYCQADDARLGGDALTSGGWCLALTIHWFKSISDGSDFWRWIGTDPAVVALRFLMARQKATEAVAKSVTSAKTWGVTRGLAPADTEWLAVRAHKDFVQRAYVEVIKYNFRFVGQGEWDHLATFAGRFAEVHDAGGPVYMMLHFTKPSGSAHTIGAIVNADGSTSIMDPNLGHIGFRNTGDAENWITEFGANPGLGYVPMRRLNTECYNLPIAAAGAIPAAPAPPPF